MIKSECAKEHLISTAYSFLGLPYKWGGDDPSGFDCSGFVNELLKTIGLLSEDDDFTADSLMKYLLSHTSINQFSIRKIDNPVEGSLLFYLNKEGEAFHVDICLDEFFRLGASGGDSSVFTERDAWRNNAYIKIRPIKVKEGSGCIISLF